MNVDFLEYRIPNRSYTVAPHASTESTSAIKCKEMSSGACLCFEFKTFREDFSSP